MHTNDILRAALIGFNEQRDKITAQIRDINVQLAHSEMDRGPQQGPLAKVGDKSLNAFEEVTRISPGIVAQYSARGKNWTARTKRHAMSAEGRARIAAAQRKRWAKLRRSAKAAA